jgi:hypothetical protein
MRTETGQTIHLKDYAPPDWLVETVDLDFSLHPNATKVRALLLLKPNPKTAAAPLVLDGDGLTLKSLKIDGAAPAADSYIATPDHSAAAAAAVPARDRNRSRSDRQHPAFRPLPFQRHLLHAMRSRGIPPHHVFPRSPRRHGGLYDADRSRQGRSACAARQWQPCIKR